MNTHKQPGNNGSVTIRWWGPTAAIPAETKAKPEKTRDEIRKENWKCERRRMDGNDSPLMPRIRS